LFRNGIENLRPNDAYVSVDAGCLLIIIIIIIIINIIIIIIMIMIMIIMIIMIIVMIFNEKNPPPQIIKLIDY